ncbi:unnamed protein product, partial [Brachionus calyciflorus]
MACGYGLSSFAASPLSWNTSSFASSWATPALAVHTLATQFGVSPQTSQCGGRSSAPTFAAVPLVASFVH